MDAAPSVGVTSEGNVIAASRISPPTNLAIDLKMMSPSVIADSKTLDVFRPIGILGVHMFFALSGC